MMRFSVLLINMVLLISCSSGDVKNETNNSTEDTNKTVVVNYDNALAKGKLPERYCRLQLVTDQIAGMTDTFAIRLHKRLMNG